MTLPSDPLQALLDHLRADAELTTRTAGRIFGGDRPAGPSGALPRRLSAPASAPAPMAAAPTPTSPLSDVQIDVRCWGGLGPGGPQRAFALWRALHAACNVGDLNVGGAHLLWALEDGGPALLRDPGTDEAFVRIILRVATADIPLGP